MISSRKTRADEMAAEARMWWRLSKDRREAMADSFRRCELAEIDEELELLSEMSDWHNLKSAIRRDAARLADCA